MLPTTPRSLTVLSGGIGGAKFLQGLLHGLRTGLVPAAPDAEVTVIANTADDIWVHGLKVCPDLDTVMYTLGDGIDPERGWGRRAAPRCACGCAPGVSTPMPLRRRLEPMPMPLGRRSVRWWSTLLRGPVPYCRAPSQ